MKRDYFLTTPKDAHGQPLRIFKANLENNVSKSIDQLSGICCGILADGVVTDGEAKFFADWVRSHAQYEPVWPFTDILARVERVMADGRIDDDEREELKAVMETICGHVSQAAPTQDLSTRLPLDEPAPETILFDGKVFSITGRFAVGTRAKVIEALARKGAQGSDSPPSRGTDYLVIGVFASRDWIYSSYGRKIERAVELRNEGGRIAIISEEHWRSFVDPVQSAA